MNYPANPYMNFNNMDPEITQKILDRLMKEPELVQSLYSLYYRVMEMNPGERFTRYAKRELREKLAEKELEKQFEKVAQKTEDKKEEIAPKKKSLQLAKAFEKINTPVLPKLPEFVLDNHSKVVEKFLELEKSIKPNEFLENFKNIPILDLNKKATIEEMNIKRIRVASFHKN